MALRFHEGETPAASWTCWMEDKYTSCYLHNALNGASAVYSRVKLPLPNIVRMLRNLFSSYCTCTVISNNNTWLDLYWFAPTDPLHLEKIISFSLSLCTYLCWFCFWFSVRPFVVVQLNRKITDSDDAAAPRAHHQKKLAKETADDAHRFGKNGTGHTRARVIAGKIVRFVLLLLLLLLQWLTESI